MLEAQQARLLALSRTRNARMCSLWMCSALQTITSPQHNRAILRHTQHPNPAPRSFSLLHDPGACLIACDPSRLCFFVCIYDDAVLKSGKDNFRPPAGRGRRRKPT